MTGVPVKLPDFFIARIKKYYYRVLWKNRIISE